MNFTELKQALGPIRSAECNISLSDHEYHNQLEFASSSTVKNYLNDPVLAAQRRVLQTVESKTWDVKARQSMRIGRAVHAYVFEGESIFKQRYPIFTGGRRGTKAWEKFVEENADAEKNDNILSADEADTVFKLGSKGSKAYQGYIQNMPGVNILAQIPECSFYLTYESGLKVKVRADVLFICQSANNPSQYFFFVMDGKTTRRAITDTTSLSFTIDKLGYDVSGAMYLNTIHECLQQSALWPQLIPGFDVSQWPATIPLWGSFEIFWMSTDTYQCGFQSLMNISDDLTSENNAWAANGISGYYLGLLKWAAELQRVKAKITQATTANDKEILEEVFHVHAPPLKTHQYTLGGRQEGISATPVTSFVDNEESLGSVVTNTFKPAPKPRPAPAPQQMDLGISMTPPPLPTKVKEVAKKDTAVGMPKNKSAVARLNKSDIKVIYDKLGLEMDGNKNLRTLQKILKDHLFGGKE